jgi:hypothetical protein
MKVANLIKGTLFLLAVMLSGKLLAIDKKEVKGFAQEHLREALEDSDLDEIEYLLDHYIFAPLELGDIFITLFLSESNDKKKIFRIGELLQKEGAELPDSELTLELWFELINKNDQDFFDMFEKMEGYQESLKRLYIFHVSFIEFLGKNPSIRTFPNFEPMSDLMDKVAIYFESKKDFSITNKEIGTLLDKQVRDDNHSLGILIGHSDLLVHASQESRALLFLRYISDGVFELGCEEHPAAIDLIGQYLKEEFPEWVSPKVILDFILSEIQKKENSETMDDFAEAARRCFWIFQAKMMKEYIQANFDSMSDGNKHRIEAVYRTVREQGIDKELQEEFFDKIGLQVCFPK